MRLRIRLPEVKPDEYVVPLTCPHGCGGRYFALHQCVQKRMGDPNYSAAVVRRYKCVTCGRSFRVHPTGVSRHHRSQRLRGIGVLFYVLGLSYGGVADALAAFGWPGSKSTVYRDVQAAGAAVTRVRRQQPARRVEVASADATYVLCNRETVTVAVAVDALAGDVLEVELIDSESPDGLREFLRQLQAEYGMTVLVSDDQDSYKQLTDELGLAHSVCRAHVNRNVAKLVAELGEQALQGVPPVPPGVESSQAQLLADLEELQLLIALRPPDGAARLAGYLRRYQAAPPPAKGAKATLWYRFRLALLRWANAWPRLVYDLTWNRTHATQPNAPRLDGTNNVAERAIGWWIKDRYRTMRTFKRRASVRNLARLIPYLAAHPDQPCLTQLLAA
jgi:transposase-like protein